VENWRPTADRAIVARSAPVRQTNAALEVETPRRGLARRRRGNRRAIIQPTPMLVAVADGLGSFGRGLLAVCQVLGKLILLCVLLAALLGGGRLAVRHVMASPRFALRMVEVSEAARVSRDEVVELAGVTEGDRLLALDTDAIAARIAQHPWVGEARVRRQLPSALRIELAERRAAAVAALGGLYLIDEAGRPFKRATMAEADGLPVITGLDRDQYVDHRAAVEAAFREALGLVAAWRARPGRPGLSEVNLAPRYGFSLFLLEGGAEIRLGRGQYDRKLASLDRILEAVTSNGASWSTVRVVHLDGTDLGRITVQTGAPGTLASSSERQTP
jgi:cell division protein FtsQ